MQWLWRRRNFVGLGPCFSRTHTCGFTDKFIDVFVQTVSNWMQTKITLKMWDVVFKVNVYVKLKLHAQLHLNSVYCWWCGLDAWFGYTHCHCTWGPNGRWEVDRWCWSVCHQTESTALPGNPSVLVGMAQCCRSGTSFCDPHRTYRRFWAYNNGKINDYRGATQSLNLKITLSDL